MPIDPPRAVDPATARKVRNLLGHYATEVAAALFKEGVPVRGISVAGLCADDEAGEAEAYLRFAPAYTRVLSETNEVALTWNDRSGWLLDLDLSEEGYRSRARWLADGLLPTPDRVATFMLTACLAPAEVGSSHRPFYRQEADSHEPLLKQLAAFHPGSTGRLGYNDWTRRFRARQQDAYQRWIVDDLTPDVNAPTVNVSLRTSEAKALLRALELAEAHDGHRGLVGALASDLRARIEKADVVPTAPQPSSAVELAREQKTNRVT